MIEVIVSWRITSLRVIPDAKRFWWSPRGGAVSAWMKVVASCSESHNIWCKPIKFIFGHSPIRILLLLPRALSSVGSPSLACL